MSAVSTLETELIVKGHNNEPITKCNALSMLIRSLQKMGVEVEELNPETGMLSVKSDTVSVIPLIQHYIDDLKDFH
jgi:hypothetical protein